MDHTFERRPLLDQGSLERLRERRDAPSIVRMTLHVGAVVLCARLLVWFSDTTIVAIPVMVLLAQIVAPLFAPFHECAHRTAFRTGLLNDIGAWLAGVPCGFSPSAFRALHVEHHRHTNDSARDPEMGGPEDEGGLPLTSLQWLSVVLGWWHFRFKTLLLVRLSVLPVSRWEAFAPWAPPGLRRHIAWEARVVAGLWLALVAAAWFDVPGARWMLGALALSHVFQGAWQSLEHRGMPKDGPVLTRTRSLRSPLVVRWLVWNSNFHAEHHAWPGIQWHSFHGIWSGRTDCDTTSALVGTGVASTTSITAPHTFELFMTSSSVR